MVYKILPPKCEIKREKLWLKHFVIIWSKGIEFRRIVRKERKHPSIYIYHPRGGHSDTWNHLTQSMVINQYNVDP
jgi:hypothetical protein